MSQVKTMLAAGMPEDIEKGGKMDIRLLYGLIITTKKKIISSEFWQNDSFNENYAECFLRLKMAA